MTENLSENPYELTTLPEITLRQLSATVGGEPEIDAVVGPMFGRLLTAMAAAGLDTEQPTLAWYNGAGGDSEDRTEIGVGLPVTGPVNLPPEFAEHTLPAVPQAFTTRFQGSLRSVPAAWQALHEHARTQGKTPAGPCREVYHAGDLASDDWVIDLQQPVR